MKTKEFTRRKLLNLSAYLLLIAAAVLVILTLLMQIPSIQKWYEQFQFTLVEFERAVASIPYRWLIPFVIELLFLVKAWIPVIPVSAIGVISGMVFSQFGDAAFHQLFGELRIFQLVTNGYAFTRTYQFGRIRIKRMVRKSRHFDCFPFAIGTLRQSNAQYLGSYNGIGGISLIEVTTTKQHDGIRMFCLQIKELFHHRGKDNIFIHNGIFLEFNVI